jgi:hypothetical protein
VTNTYSLLVFTLHVSVIRMSNRRYRPFREARALVHSLGLKNVSEWTTYCKSANKPNDIPASPYAIYADQWKSWGDWLGTGIIKQKLTLAVNKDVIEQAKSAGINISSMTERLLQSYMIDRETSTKDDVAKAYENLFDTMKTILQKYDAAVQVGENSGDKSADYKVFLDANNGLYLMENTQSRKISNTSIKEVLSYLYAPRHIIEKLIFVALDSAEINKKKIIELSLAQRLVKVIFEQK